MAHSFGFDLQCLTAPISASAAGIGISNHHHDQQALAGALRRKIETAGHDGDWFAKLLLAHRGADARRIPLPATYELPRHPAASELTAEMVHKFKEEWKHIASPAAGDQPMRAITGP